MSFFNTLFSSGYPSNMDRRMKNEAETLITELIEIGKKVDYLSERPGGEFNGQCHNIRARAIGKRLNELGGLDLMQLARQRVKKKLKMNIASHLDYAWDQIGRWKA